MSDILLAEIERAYMRQEIGDDGRTVRHVSLHIPSKPKVIEHSLKQPVSFWLEKAERVNYGYETNIASHEAPLPPPSGGAIPMFSDYTIAFPQKEAYLPGDPGRRVPCSGYPAFKEEWYSLDNIVRETNEELIMITKDNHELVIPENDVGVEIIYKTADNLKEKAGLKIDGEIKLPIKFLDGRDTLNIHEEDSLKSEHSVVVSWTPEIGLNALKVLDVQHPSFDLYLIDGEILPNGKPLTRDMCIIHQKNIQGKRFGDTIVEKVHHYNGDNTFKSYVRKDRLIMDKVSRSVLNQIELGNKPLYPIDWLDESILFLSQPNLPRPKKGQSWVEIERKIKIKDSD